MKKNLFKGLVMAMGVGLLTASCSDESSSIGAGMGRIIADVEVDPEVITASDHRSSRSIEDGDLPSVSDLSLKLTSEDGTYSKVWNSVDDFDSTEDFKTGRYTLEAYYGSADDAEGKGKPYFYGKQQLEVKFDRTTSVALNASMANSRVKIAYTDAFRNYMTSYSVQLLSPQGRYIDVAADDAAPVYVTDGTVKVNLTFTKPNGNTATLEAASFTAKVKTEHTVTIDVNGGDTGADAVLKVSFDDTVEAEDVEIDLSDEVLNAPAPELIAEGWSDGQEFTITEGASAPAAIKMNVFARGKIASVMLSTDSYSLRQAGWPASIDLATADDATVSVLKGLGLSARGIWGKPDISGQLDFSGVLPRLTLAAGQDQAVSTFTVEVKDCIGKLSERLSFSVIVTRGMARIVSAESMTGSNTINAVVEYNDADLASNVTFDILDIQGTGAWTPLEIVSVTPAARSTDNALYNVTLKSAKTVKESAKIRAVYRGVKSESTVAVQTPDFSVSLESDADAYATHAYLTLTSADAAVSSASLASEISAVTIGGTSLPFTVNGAQIHVSGLTPATANNVTVKIGSKTASAAVSTEAAAQLPNAGMETSSTSASGSYWKRYEFEGWGTNNYMTTNHSGSNYAYCKISGTIPTTDSRSGNAVLLRTCGWGSGNTATGSNGTSGNCRYTDPGLLHLGATRETRPAGYGQNDNKTNNCSTGPTSTDDLAPLGISFASRPSSMTFYYKYAPKNGADKGYAEITVKDAEGNVISSKTLLLPATSSYTLASLPLEYPANAAKAGNIYVKFLSSYDAEYIKRTNDNFSGPGFGNLSNGTFMGSQLYIDDIQLNY